MSSIRMGPATTPPGGSAITLPPLRYVGEAPGLPTTIDPQTEEARVSDGNRRWAFFEIKREWSHAWGYLTYGQLTTLLGLVTTPRIMDYQNNWVSTTWRQVVIVSFSYDFIRPGIKKYKKFKADMTLREA